MVSLKSIIVATALVAGAFGQLASMTKDEMKAAKEEGEGQWNYALDWMKAMKDIPNFKAERAMVVPNTYLGTYAKTDDSKVNLRIVDVRNAPSYSLGHINAPWGWINAPPSLGPAPAMIAGAIWNQATNPPPKYVVFMDDGSGVSATAISLEYAKLIAKSPAFAGQNVGIVHSGWPSVSMNTFKIAGTYPADFFVPA